jgi:hypothetical protein
MLRDYGESDSVHLDAPNTPPYEPFGQHLTIYQPFFHLHNIKNIARDLVALTHVLWCKILSGNKIKLSMTS